MALYYGGMQFFMPGLLVSDTGRDEVNRVNSWSVDTIYTTKYATVAPLVSTSGNFMM